MKRIIMVLAVAALFGASVAQADTTSNALAGAAAQQGLVNSPTINIPASVIPTETKLKNTPAFGMSGPASGPCNGFSGGLTGVVAGFGGGVNFSKVDEGCEDRETARMLGLLGEKEAGVQLLKSSEAWQRHLERTKQQAAAKKAEAPAPVQASTAPQVVAATDPTCTTDEFVARRLNKSVCGK